MKFPIKNYLLDAIKFNVFNFSAGGFAGNLLVFAVDNSLSKLLENVNYRFSIIIQRTKRRCSRICHIYFYLRLKKMK